MLDYESRPESSSLQTIRCSLPVPVDVDIDRPERELITGHLKEHAMQEGNQGSVHFSSAVSSFERSNMIPRRQPTAQLTMFYSGTVNVYDAVPADKAHAIILLASGGNSWSSHSVKPSSTAVTTSANETAPLALSAAMTTPATRNESGVSFGTLVSSSPAPRLVQRSEAELPFARKASLARFLNKRRDRVQATPIVNPATVIEKDEIVSAPEQAASPKRICSRPPSSSNIVDDQARPACKSPMTPSDTTYNKISRH